MLDNISMESIGQAIYQAIEEEKWLYITYNQKDGQTFFWLEVTDILPKEKIIKGVIRNFQKSDDGKDAFIKFDKIASAQVLNFTKARPCPALWDRLNKKDSDYAWMNYPHFDNNILLYLKECRYLDCNPGQKNYSLIDGIDLEKFKNDKEYKLTTQQQRDIAIKILHENNDKKDKSSITLAISALAIDRGKNKYIVAYYVVSFDPDKSALIIDPEIKFNGNVWGVEDDDKSTPFASFLTSYAENVKKDKRKAEAELEASLSNEYGYKYIMNTRPVMMVLENPYHVSYGQTFETIQKEYEEKKLPYSLKAFFGESTRRGQKKIEPSIVLFDDKVDIDQMRAIYSSMKQPVSYVQGPPGTGKTQTLLNVILSEFLNGNTVLMTSQNNKPVDDIIKKLSTALVYNNNLIDLPYIRLGNQGVRIQACKRILSFYERKLPMDNTYLSEQDILSVREENNRANKNLMTLLSEDEKHTILEEQYEALLEYEKTFLDSNSLELTKEIKERKEKLISLLNNYPKPKDDEARKLFSPANKSQRFLKFLYDQSVNITKRLRSEKFKDLISICYNKDDQAKSKALKAWLIHDDNLKLFLSVFPIVFTTNLSSCDLGTGKPFFDMVVMDEAGQCNATDALLALARGNRLLMVGDPKQLKPVIQLNPSANKRLMDKYKVPQTYNYLTNSILDMMLANDKSSNDILLEYHYRCASKIISFPNSLYYGDKLKLNKLKEVGKLGFYDCKNFGTTNNNTAIEEAKACVSYIKRNGYKDTTILTPFVNQSLLINQMLKQEGIPSVKAVSVHKMQGSENKTILFSLAISPKTSKRTWDWIKNNRELINVAMTRAKDAFVLFADKEVAKKLGNGKEDVSKLIQYMENNGNGKVVKTERIENESPYANQSQAERDFFVTIAHFCTCNPNYVAKRNMMTYEVFPDDPLAKKIKGNFDLVLYASEQDFQNHKPSLVFEINGGEHIGSFSAEKRDVRKNWLCENHGVKETFIPNSSVRNYSWIQWIVEDCAKLQQEKKQIKEDKDINVEDKKEIMQAVIEKKEVNKAEVSVPIRMPQREQTVEKKIEKPEPKKEKIDAIAKESKIEENVNNKSNEAQLASNPEAYVGENDAPEEIKIPVKTSKQIVDEVKVTKEIETDKAPIKPVQQETPKEEKHGLFGWLKSVFGKKK